MADMGLTLADMIHDVSVSGVSSGEGSGEVRVAVFYTWLCDQWLTLTILADEMSQ